MFYGVAARLCAAIRLEGAESPAVPVRILERGRVEDLA